MSALGSRVLSDRGTPRINSSLTMNATPMSGKIDRIDSSQKVSQMHIGSLASAVSKKNKTRQEKEENSMLNTARSNFPSNADMSKHLQSNMNRDKNSDTSFIASSKFQVSQGVTIRLENGKILRHIKGAGES